MKIMKATRLPGTTTAIDNNDPILFLTAIQGIVLRYRNIAASGKYDAERPRLMRRYADALEMRTRELDREYNQ
jgi:hypothetical protein